jgi:hypothetical protein
MQAEKLKNLEDFLSIEEEWNDRSLGSDKISVSLPLELPQGRRKAFHGGMHVRDEMRCEILPVAQRLGRI